MCIKPSPRVLWSWGSALLIPLILLTASGVWLCARLLRPLLPLWLLLMGALWLWCGVYLLLRRRRLCFAVTDGYICVTDGVWITTRRMIPLEAVRQVTLLQGPVERLCRTAFILVNATGGYLLIEGIDQRQAEAWCRRLTPDA